jgi:WD40 repeat protein
MILIDPDDGATGGVGGLAFAPAGRHLVVRYADRVRVWDDGGLRPWAGKLPGLRAAGFAPDGRVVAVCHAPGEPRLRAAVGPPGGRPRTAKTAADADTPVGLAADGAVLFTLDGRVCRWRPAGDGEVEATGVPAVRAAVVGGAPDGRRVAVGRGAANAVGIELWEPWAAAPAVRLDAGPGMTVDSLAWSADGRWLAAVVPYRLMAWDLETGERSEPVLPNARLFRGPSFDPSGAWLLAGGPNVVGGAHVWAVGSWRPAAAYAWPVGRATATAWSADGLLAACGGEGGRVAVWDADG